jgi:hypothetical protein
MKRDKAREATDNRKMIILNGFIEKYGDVKLSEVRHRLRVKLEKPRRSGRPRQWDDNVEMDIYIAVLLIRQRGFGWQEAKRAFKPFWKMSLKQVETGFSNGRAHWEKMTPSYRAEILGDPEPMGPEFQTFLDSLTTTAATR